MCVTLRWSRRRARAKVRVDSAKNDQTGEGEVTVVYADEQSELVCPVARSNSGCRQRGWREARGALRESQGVISVADQHVCVTVMCAVNCLGM